MLFDVLLVCLFGLLFFCGGLFSGLVVCFVYISICWWFITRCWVLMMMLLGGLFGLVVGCCWGLWLWLGWCVIGCFVVMVWVLVAGESVVFVYWFCLFCCFVVVVAWFGVNV